MKFKLDENLPATAASVLGAQPHRMILPVIRRGAIQARHGLSRAGPGRGRPPATCPAGTRIPLR